MTNLRPNSLPVESSRAALPALLAQCEEIISYVEAFDRRSNEAWTWLSRPVAEQRAAADRGDDQQRPGQVMRFQSGHVRVSVSADVLAREL